MYKGKSILCIIPARGGSKGLPGKNIKELNGQPLIAYTIEQAQNSSYIDSLIISTDSKEIMIIADLYNCSYIQRSEQFATDVSPVSDTICEVINDLKYNHGTQFDIVLMLECTSPLRRKDDIDNAIEMFIDNYGTTDSLVAVGELTSDTEHPYCVKIEDDGYLQPFIKDSPAIYQRQQLDKAYSVFGGIYIVKVYQYIQRKTFYMERTIGFKVDRWQKFEIDDIVDFICVEALMKKHE